MCINDVDQCHRGNSLTQPAHPAHPLNVFSSLARLETTLSPLLPLRYQLQCLLPEIAQTVLDRAHTSGNAPVAAFV